MHSPDQEFASIGAKTHIEYGKRFVMFKKFLMDNAHQETVKNLFRWWNGHVFLFDMPIRKDDEFDTGMEEAEAALNSDEDLSSKDLSGDKIGNNSDHDSWYALAKHQADQPALQMNISSHCDDLSVNFVQLTISEHISQTSLTLATAPLNPLVVPVHAVAVPQIHEPSLVYSVNAAIGSKYYNILLIMTGNYLF